jgi:acetate kinase
MVKIVVLNAGSSSQKSKLYELAEELPEQPPRPLWKANAELEYRDYWSV